MGPALLFFIILALLIAVVIGRVCYSDSLAPVPLEWGMSGPEWQARPHPMMMYGVIQDDEDGLWYPYFFQGMRYKRGRTLCHEGVSVEHAKHICEEHWLNLQTEEANRA